LIYRGIKSRAIRACTRLPVKLAAIFFLRRVIRLAFVKELLKATEVISDAA
jgi:hypothetical protein